MFTIKAVVLKPEYEVTLSWLVRTRTPTHLKTRCRILLQTKYASLYFPNLQLHWPKYINSSVQKGLSHCAVEWWKSQINAQYSQVITCEVAGGPFKFCSVHSVLNSGTKGLITSSIWRQMQTEKEETSQSVSFFNQPKHADTWASLHQVSQERVRWIIISTLKRQIPHPNAHCVSHNGNSASDVSFCQAKWEERTVNA